MFLNKVSLHIDGKWMVASLDKLCRKMCIVFCLNTGERLFTEASF